MFFGKTCVLLTSLTAFPFGLFVNNIVLNLRLFIFLAIFGACFPAEAEIKMHPSTLFSFIFWR